MPTPTLAVMDDEEVIRREELGDAVAELAISDCKLAFRRQRGTRDLWSVVTGPLGTIAAPVLRGEVLDRVRHGRQSPADPRVGRAARRYRDWARVRIDEDLVLAVRARGNQVDLEFLFSDGMPFGGASGGLPTNRRPNLTQRVQLWLSGRRGEALHFYSKSDSTKTRRS